MFRLDTNQNDRSDTVNMDRHVSYCQSIVTCGAVCDRGNVLRFVLNRSAVGMRKIEVVRQQAFERWLVSLYNRLCPTGGSFADGCRGILCTQRYGKDKRKYANRFHTASDYT